VRRGAKLEHRWAEPMKLQKRGHADWFGADDSPSGTTSSRMPTGEAKKAIAPTAPRTGSLAPRATRTPHRCVASVCPSAGDPITDICGRDGTAFTHGAALSRRAARREQTSKGRQIRENPVTAMTTTASHLRRSPANALQLQLDPTARA